MCRPRRGTTRGHASATILCEGRPEYGGQENCTEASQGEAAFLALWMVSELPRGWPVSPSPWPGAVYSATLQGHGLAAVPSRRPVLGRDA